MFWNNELSILKKENKIRNATLCQKDQKLIRDLLIHLNVSKLSAFEAEVLKKDLIGMAQEAMQRQESLDTVIGADREAFCRSMLEGCRRRPVYEQCLPIAKEVTFWWMMYAVVFWFEGRLIPSVPFSCYDIFLFVWVIIFVCYDHYFKPAFVLKRGIYPYTAPVLLMGLLILLVAAGNTGWRHAAGAVTLFHINGYLFLGIPVFLFLAAHLSFNSYIGSQAKNYNWKDSV